MYCTDKVVFGVFWSDIGFTFRAHIYCHGDMQLSAGILLVIIDEQSPKNDSMVGGMAGSDIEHSTPNNGPG